jgi:hypothetical protein
MLELTLKDKYFKIDSLEAVVTGEVQVAMVQREAVKVLYV